MREPIRDLLKIIGADLNDPNFTKTPERYEKAIEELLCGRRVPPPELATFETKQSGELVYIGNLHAASLCPHHLFPFLVKAYFAYIPGKKVVGISKPGRLLQWVCARLILQEEIGPMFLDLFEKSVDSKGSIILIKGWHLCSTIRGAKQEESSVVTVTATGKLAIVESSAKSEYATRREFFELIKMRTENG